MTAMVKNSTPLMKQYWSMKSVHPDKILFFRMGDFFEMFHDDALLAAPLLGIALTARNKKSNDQTPMCGIPHRSIETPINKLLSLGKKVAICDQVEDPKLAKGLVKREVTRVLTPGMVYDPESLMAHQPNYLCALDKGSLAFMDSTTGECFYYLTEDIKKQKQLIANLGPVEVVLSKEQGDFFSAREPEDWKGFISFHEGLYKPDENKNWPSSALRLLDYGVFTQGLSLLKGLKDFEERPSRFRMEISTKSIEHLEVFKTYKGEQAGSLFSAINKTKTPGGARLLRHWILFPLTDLKEIQKRQDRIVKWTRDMTGLQQVRQTLSKVGDIERKFAKLSQPASHPRDLQNLCQSLESALELVPQMMEDFSGTETLNGNNLSVSESSASSRQAFAVAEKVSLFVKEVGQALVEELPGQYRDGGFIKKGFDPRLDELIKLASNSQGQIRELEQREREQTGIPSLKVRYNNVFGYYIEVTNTHKDKAPLHRYQRKQTLVNAERYITDELVSLEKKVITAKTRRVELELEIFESLKNHGLEISRELLFLAETCKKLDVFSSLAWLALEWNYVKPELKKGGAFELRQSRHPVAEQILKNSFVPNDIFLNPYQCLLLTGPNMAGKSTIMKQVALISLLAQIGSFVPASSASLPIVDKIFTRIGASDLLTEGFSTFMVEMKETAEMLHFATSESLVILDEVGRGTSTYDGMSLAQALLEYFITKIKSYTLFATHYHELTALEEKEPEGLVNKHMTINEDGEKISFGYHLHSGPAHKSYGIQVAELAGLPSSLIDRAFQILDRLEKKMINLPERKDFKNKSTGQLNLFQSDQPNEECQKALRIIKSLDEMDLGKTTPLEALNRLDQWKKEFADF